jgi:hypothetical protein
MASYILFLILAAILLWQYSLAVVQDQQGTLKLQIVDEASKKPTPARVELLDQDGKAYVAEDALGIGDDFGDREVPWQGRLEDAKATLFRFKKFHNAYTGTEQFYSVGNCHVSLPASAYTLKVTKGKEYRPQARKIRIHAGETVELTVEMPRWIDMPKQGWYSADDHVHISRTFKELDPFISKLMQAEDLHVANLLQWGNSRHFHNTIQYSFGPAGVYQEGDYILSPGQENPRTHFLGHAIVLGAQRPINFPDSYLVYKLVFEEANRQGALNGFAHGGRDFVPGLDVVHGLMNFLEVYCYFEHKDYLYNFWYDCLNAGFRITPTAGTDYAYLGEKENSYPGDIRFYTQVNGRLTYEAWLEGVRLGRTFATNGPMLEFRVGGKGMGEEVRLENPGKVAVEGRVRFDPRQDAVERLEVIQNGEVIQSFSRKGNGTEIHGEFQHEVNRACWLAVRSSGTRPGEKTKWIEPTGQPRPSVTHSAPIYVNVENGPTLSAHPRAKAVARKWLKGLEGFEKRLADDSLAEEGPEECPDPDECVSVNSLRKYRPALLKVVQDAKQLLADRAR